MSLVGLEFESTYTVLRMRLRTWLRLYQEMKAHTTIVICVDCVVWVCVCMRMQVYWLVYVSYRASSLGEYTDKPSEQTSVSHCNTTRPTTLAHVNTRKTCAVQKYIHARMPKRFEREIENVLSISGFTSQCLQYTILKMFFFFFKYCDAVRCIVHTHKKNNGISTLICFHVRSDKNIVFSKTPQLLPFPDKTITWQRLYNSNLIVLLAKLFQKHGLCFNKTVYFSTSAWFFH